LRTRIATTDFDGRLAAKIEQSLLAKPDSKLAAKSEQSLLTCLTSSYRQKLIKICAGKFDGKLSTNCEQT